MQGLLLTCIVIITIEVRAAAAAADDDSYPRLVAESVGFNSDLSSKRTRKCHLSFCRPAAASRAKMPSVLVMLAMPIRRLIEEAFMPNSRSGSQGLDGSIACNPTGRSRVLEPLIARASAQRHSFMSEPRPRTENHRTRQASVQTRNMRACTGCLACMRLALRSSPTRMEPQTLILIDRPVRSSVGGVR